MKLHGHAPICPLRQRDHCIGACIGVGIGYERGMHRGTHQVITLSVEVGEGGFGARPYFYNKCLHFSICACHPRTGAMLIFSASFQSQRMIPEGNPKHTHITIVAVPYEKQGGLQNTADLHFDMKSIYTFRLMKSILYIIHFGLQNTADLHFDISI